MAGMLLAQGSLSVGRLDAVLAFTLAWTLWAAAERKPGTMGFALGAATASKFLPALLAVPLVMADRPAWRQMSARWKAAIGFAIAVVVGFAPMFVPPDAFLGVLSYHSKRGLQVESSFGVLISTWRLITHTLVPATLSYGSFNHDGPVASFFAHMATPVTLLMMGGVAVVFARAAEPKDDIARRDRLALVLLAGVTALWLSAKVFSPQYLTWAMPLVLGVSGKRGRTLTWLLFLIYWITQYEMTGDYGNIMQQRPLGVLTLLVRLPLIVAFGVVAVRGLGRRSNERVAKSEPVVAGGGLAPSEANLE
jgi:hypothetical protein